jgi:glyoxylase-like metal-dependent hydrolase (beta-lactamase superfamily II)
LKLGDLEFHFFTAGYCSLDGGAMFGVIPKTMWEKKIPPDGRNRIQLALNSVLILAGGKRILVETGAGDKWTDKLKDIYAFEGPCLMERLRDFGLHREQIDIVVNTHLHFDHCGGNTQTENGKVVAAFPNARYIVQRGDFEHGLKPTERDRASYYSENYEPLQTAGKLSLLEGDRVIAPGVELVRTPGHTADMQCVKLTGGGKTAFFFADLVPTTAHLPLPWIMGFDLYPLTTLETKKKWIPEVVRGEWLALFGHEIKTPAAYLRGENGDWTAEPVKVD